MAKTNKVVAKEVLVNLAIILGSGIYKNVQVAKGQISRRLPEAKETGFLIPEKEAKDFIRTISKNEKSRAQVPATELLKVWDEKISKLENVYNETYNKKKVNMTKVSSAFNHMKGLLNSNKYNDKQKIERAIEIIEALEEGGDE